nr:hypothetical protein [Clostridia bacterium]
MKKIILFTLVLALLLPLTAACSSGDDEGNSVGTAASDNADTTAAETTAEAADPNSVLEIPEGVKYDGYEFGILVYEAGANSSESGYQQIRNYSPVVAAEENGEAINDAVFQRNRMVEEKLDIKIKPIIAEKGQLTSTIAKEVQAGESSFDSAFQMLRAAQKAGMEGYLVRLDEVDTIHLEKDWWEKAFQREGAINNALFVLVGDATLEDKEGTACQYYNEKLAEEHGFEDIYETVNEGKWTIDLSWERWKAVAKDLDGDGVLNQNDVMGTGTNYSALRSFLNSFNTGYAKLENGAPVSLLDDEYTVSAIMKFAQFANDTTCVLISGKVDGGYNAFTAMFKDNRMLVRGGSFYNSPAFRDMESEFSIIPTPKFDEKQENYRSSGSPHASYGFVIPVTCDDPERVGVIMETMSYYSGDTVIDAYINITLEGKIARNEESVAMLHKIIAGAYYDIGYVYNWADIDKVLQGAVKTADSTFVSTYASIKDKYLKAMEETYNMYK